MNKKILWESNKMTEFEFVNFLSKLSKAIETKLQNEYDDQDYIKEETEKIVNYLVNCLAKEAISAYYGTPDIL